MADFSQNPVSVCFVYRGVCPDVGVCSCEHGCACMCAFSFRALTLPCETVMWALKFNNFRETIGDRNLKSAFSFPQQQRK